ncbi:MAG TPA: hypothetical protein VFX43_06040 [Chitinophagaceae bacterium]|nr:hypothetical protein [Chitinophagaceae bacterium]
MKKQKNTRREFIRMAAISGVGIGMAGSVTPLFAQSHQSNAGIVNLLTDGTSEASAFVPHRAASWWCTLDDILWPQKSVIDNIKRRAEGFAAAKIDTAINFGFHVRFDFSNYFGQLHGYYANVCEELHKYNIRFLDHYSCNDVERPRGESEIRKLNRDQRHHVLLYPDPIAAKFAQYEGHFFQDICEIDLRDGSRGYARQYQMEMFCHNNPAFLDMHKKYLQRHLREIPADGFEIDDMCDYAGLTTCGCKYCRERFKRDYGHEIPAFEDKSFWGETANKSMLYWGNYENPAFRDWISMKTDVIVDHLKMIKSVIGDRPLMTCCSSAGPIVLNAISLNLEKMAPYLNFFMLENTGINIKSVYWVAKEPEAFLQKDAAAKSGNAPAMALSYTIYEEGGYLGWCLSRFWGVANWSSTLDHRLVEDPIDAVKIQDIISPYNNWEILNSNLNYRDGKDLVEIRLVSNLYCRENGWRRSDGHEQWDAVKSWVTHAVSNNVGYRMLRAAELSDPVALSKENTPLVIDSVGCLSDSQFKAIKAYLQEGGILWLALPFGTHNEKGFKREAPLSKELLKEKYKNLTIVNSAVQGDPLKKLIADNKFRPVLTQLAVDRRWAARIRFYKDKPVIHFMNTALIAIPHPTLKDISGTPVLKDIKSKISDNHLSYRINTEKIPIDHLSAMTPELGDQKINVIIDKTDKKITNIKINLSGVKIYAIAQ